MANITYLVTTEDGAHSRSEEFDTFEAAREEYKDTIKYYSEPDAPKLEFVVLETADDYEIIYEHFFE